VLDLCLVVVMCALVFKVARIAVGGGNRFSAHWGAPYQDPTYKAIAVMAASNEAFGQLPSNVSPPIWLQEGHIPAENSTSFDRVTGPRAR
jgi:hypothetical protein